MMKSDQWVNVVLVVLITIHLSILIIGMAIHKLPVLIPSLNMLVAFAVIIYWIQKQLRLQQHFIDMQEVIMLGAEIVVIATVIYFIKTSNRDYWLKVMQYIFFGIHLTIFVLFLIFMFTFKIKRLI